VIERLQEGGYCEACQVHSFPMHAITFADGSRAWLCTHCTDRHDTTAPREHKDDHDPDARP